MFKVNNKNTVFIVNFENISQLFLVFFVDFEQINVS